METKAKRLIRGDLSGHATIMTFDGVLHRLMIRKHFLFISEDNLFDTLRFIVEEQVYCQYELFADILDQSSLRGTWNFEGKIDDSDRPQEEMAQHESLVSAKFTIAPSDIDWSSQKQRRIDATETA